MSYTWSYSAINLFKQCPKKYHHLKILKDIVEPQSEALLFGNRVHQAAEFYVKENTPLPKELGYLEETLCKIKEIKGDRLCEYRMGLTKDLQPCGFFDKKVWWRGIADLIVLGDNKAYLIDYKTGKSSRYADVKQLEILSLAMFKHFPKIKKIKAGLLFIITKELIKKNFSAGEQDKCWEYWVSNTNDLENTLNTDVWNAKPNFTCRNYCAVLSCSHNGRGE
jgi:hypothetical protein|tara:strand:+ start:173 stop:838 length:666 start_codon:yes stop_codon:yes gene_type:complete